LAKDKLNQVLQKHVNMIENEIEIMKFTRPHVKALTFDDITFEEVTGDSSDALESSGVFDIKD